MTISPNFAPITLVRRASRSIPWFVRAIRRSLITAPLSLLLFNGATVHAQEIKIGGTGAALATMQVMAQAFAKLHPETKVTVLPSLGSGGGIKAMLSGAIQLAVSSRPLTEAEVKVGAVGIEYGRTPFVFATSPTNSTVGLSTWELVDIYSGKIAQWPDGKKIRLVLRPVGDSDSEMVKAISPTMRAAKEAAEQRKGMAFAVTDQDAADALEKVQGALGPITLAQIISEKRALKALKFNNVESSVKAAADGTYPLYKSLLFVSGPKTSSEVQQFIAFVRSAAGRQILQQTGHWVK